ncbi:MAG TPA: plastocyanin/azurin family copper-binding protein [Actinomycetota bacterium]|nr:plastocyanin/azurin family copper-binding protein [Actinomycetota bacterium]
MPMYLRITAMLAFATVLFAACGGEEPGTQANPRTIEIEALDEFAFDPDEVTVQSGETIRFVVTNPGEVVHEFVLGPEHVQMAHEEASEMGEEHGEMQMEDQLAAFDIEPGQTEEATVTFDNAGEMLYGCHEAGHYDAGMVGTVTVET